LYRLKRATLTDLKLASRAQTHRQIRTYWWCSPPRTGRQRMCPALNHSSSFYDITSHDCLDHGAFYVDGHMSETQFCPVFYLERRLAMKENAQTRLTSRRENYRLWFEYLRLAKKSTDKKVIDALKRSSTLYDPWGDVVSQGFHTWWKLKGHLFEERHTVRRLETTERPSDPRSLVVEIPLNQSPTKLTRKVKALIEEAWNEQNKEQKRKSKTVASADFHLTYGSEPKLRAIREMLTVYGDVYLKNPKLRGRELLKAIEIYYKKRKQKRFARVPMALVLPGSNADISTPMRNLRRYITKAEQIVLNVANGQFPGRY
jgi:hypothetical protein